MEIITKSNGSSLVFEIEGRIDTLTAPMLEAEMKKSINGVTEFTLDFEKVEYISSAGLRVLLSAQKVMNKQGTMTIKNVNSIVMDVFDITGFSDVLTIE